MFFYEASHNWCYIIVLRKGEGKRGYTYLTYNKAIFFLWNRNEMIIIFRWRRSKYFQGISSFFQFGSGFIIRINSIKEL